MYRKILAIAIPSILSNLSVPLLSLVDTALMGHEASIDPLGAIAIGAVMFNIIYYSVAFLKTGITGLTAIDYSKDTSTQGYDHLIRGFMLALGLATGILLLQTPLFHFARYFVQTDDNILHLTKHYYDIRIWAAPATLGLMVVYGWSIGRQNAWLPLFVTLFINICNLAFNLYFVLEKNMGIQGVAWGTVCAQYLGMSASLIYLALKSPSWKQLFTAKIFNKVIFKKMLAVNTNLFIRTAFLTFVFSFFTLMSAKQGKVTLAANELLMQMWLLIAYAIDGFANASESLIGRYLGEKNTVKLKEAIRKIFIASYAIAGLYCLTYFFAYEAILNLLTDKNIAITYAKNYVAWIILSPLIGVAAFIWDGIYIGATAAQEMRNAMIIATIAVFLPCYYLLFPYLGNHALWLSISLWVACRGLLQTLFANKAIFCKT